MVISEIICVKHYSHLSEENGKEKLLTGSWTIYNHNTCNCQKILNIVMHWMPLEVMDYPFSHQTVN